MAHDDSQEHLASLIDSITDKLEARHTTAENTIAALRASLAAAARGGSASAEQEKTIAMLKTKARRMEASMRAAQTVSQEAFAIGALRALRSATGHLKLSDLTWCFAAWARFAVASGPVAHASTSPAISPRSPREVAAAAAQGIHERYEAATLRVQLEEHEEMLARERAARSDAERDAASAREALETERARRDAQGPPSRDAPTAVVLTGTAESVDAAEVHDLPQASASEMPPRSDQQHAQPAASPADVSCRPAQPHSHPVARVVTGATGAPPAASSTPTSPVGRSLTWADPVGECAPPPSATSIQAAPLLTPPPPHNPAAARALAAAHAANAKAEKTYANVRRVVREHLAQMSHLPTQVHPTDPYASATPHLLARSDPTNLSRWDSFLPVRHGPSSWQPYPKGGVTLTARLDLGPPNQILSPAMQRASAQQLLAFGGRV